MADMRKIAAAAESASSGRDRGAFAALSLTLVALLAGCGEDGGTQPETLRFGQVGEIRIQLVTPLAGGAGVQGELQQALTWNSEGPWQLFESIAYKGAVGDETLRRGSGDPGAYAQLVLQLNEIDGLKLFTEDLDPDMDPDCSGDTRISFLMRDEPRGEEARWIRCSGESLEALTETEAGPDPAAARIITAARQTRNFTLGEEFLSAYSGSAPFATLDRGEDSQAALQTSRVFVGEKDAEGNWEASLEWLQLWGEHTGGPTPPPPVDWTEDMVLVGAVGQRFEAGDSVEIRRILQVESGAIVELYQRVPGDFCSPAAVTHTPFHIVTTPRIPPLVRFGEARVERVPCGA